MATINDVAARAQVSVATVSRALRGLPNVADDTRERVLRAAEELQYVADPSASRLAAGRTSTVGLALPMLGTWYYGQFFAGVESVLADHGMDVLTFPLSRPGARERFLTWMPFRKRVDALVVVDVPLSDAHLDRLSQAGVGAVLVGTESARFSTLRLENAQGARAATEHLLGLGHERIGLIGGGPREPYLFRVPEERRDGFVQAHERRGLTVDPDLVVDAPISMSGGAEAMQVLLHADDPPTAVFAMSDEMAIGAMQLATSLHLDVPHDVSIVGFDDHSVSEFIGLTTVRQDVVGFAARAAELALASLVPGARLRHEVERPRLVVRSSTTRRT